MAQSYGPCTAVDIPCRCHQRLNDGTNMMPPLLCAVEPLVGMASASLHMPEPPDRSNVGGWGVGRLGGRGTRVVQGEEGVNPGSSDLHGMLSPLLLSHMPLPSSLSTVAGLRSNAV